MKQGGMWNKLQAVEQRFEELSRQLSSPDLHSDAKRLMAVTKEHKDLSEVVATYRAYVKADEELTGAREIVSSAKDPDMIEMAKEEFERRYLELLMAARTNPEPRERRLRYRRVIRPPLDPARRAMNFELFP